MKKVLFVQISNTLLNPDQQDTATRYYNKFYDKHKGIGYAKGLHFWEIPLWIATLSGRLEGIDQELHICTNVDDTIDFINANNFDRVFFSVLNVNIDIIKDIIQESYNQPFVVGGYTDLEWFDINLKCETFDSVPEFLKECDIIDNLKYDYSLFSGMEVIPRLKLSTGCLHRCKFCTVENRVVELQLTEIVNQIMSFRELKFKLVYIDDKTFGQAKNSNLLDIIYRDIKRYNPEFEGFIIQTTVSKVLSFKTMSKYIKVVELGIETFNDLILKDLNKPASEKDIIKIFRLFQHRSVKVIVNIISGIPAETAKTYDKTLGFLRWFYKDIFSVNLYNLAIYEDTQLASEINHCSNDSNENTLEKSYLTQEKTQLSKSFRESVFELFSSKL